VITNKLNGHRALVTGASSGLGRAIASELASRGANLVLAARRSDRIAELRSELAGRYPVEIDAVEMDLSCEAGPAQMVDAATDGGREISILVNNAGIGFYGPFLEYPLNDHLATIRVNVIATTELMYRTIHHMRTHKQTSFILNIASLASFQPVANFAVYSASKAFLLSLSETLNRELAGSTISLTCVCPGGIDTEFFQRSGQVIKDKGKKFLMDPTDVAKQALNALISGKAVFVPGMVNKLMSVYPRLLPRNLAFNVATGIMESAVDRKKPG
jgi:short-subunit dehydrogenase